MFKAYRLHRLGYTYEQIATMMFITPEKAKEYAEKWPEVTKID